MKYLSCGHDKSMRVIDDHLTERLPYLEGKDREAMILEFKEWILDENYFESDIWTIPDLTDEGLREFFKRAISKH